MSDELNKKIAKDFGLENMEAEEQEKMIEKIGNLLFESVVERAVDLMDESLMTKFEGVLEKAGSDYGQIISFFKSNVSGFDKIVTEELSRLKRATASIFA
jgi:hypothetical protein